MTNVEAFARIKQKVDYLTAKIAQAPDERQTFWQERDLEAFQLALSALEYTEAIREYEACQFTA